jgi:hypothetical protein
MSNPSEYAVDWDVDPICHSLVVLLYTPTFAVRFGHGDRICSEACRGCWYLEVYWCILTC